MFDCGGDLCISVRQWLSFALGLGLVIAGLLSSQVRRKSEALTTLYK